MESIDDIDEDLFKDLDDWVTASKRRGRRTRCFIFQFLEEYDIITMIDYLPTVYIYILDYIIRLMIFFVSGV